MAAGSAVATFAGPSNVSAQSLGDATLTASPFAMNAVATVTTPGTLEITAYSSALGDSMGFVGYTAVRIA